MPGKVALVAFFVSLGWLPLRADNTDFLIAPGNAVSFTFNTANIPGGAPPGWGTQCAAFVVGSAYGSALWYDRTTPSTTGYVVGLDFMLGNSHMASDTMITLAISKAEGDVFTARRNWRSYFGKFGTNFRFVQVIGEDAEQRVWHYPESGSLVPWKVYRLTYTVDFVHQINAWAVDGTLVDSEPMLPGNPQNVATLILGSSGSSDGRNTMFFIDNVTQQEINPNMPPSLREVFPSLPQLGKNTISQAGTTSRSW